MHVIFDGRVMAYQYTGLGRFTGELLFALLDMSRDDGIKYTVIIWENPATVEENFYYLKLRQYEKNDICRVLSVPCRPVSLGQHFCLARFINRLGGDLYFYPHFDLPFGIRIPSVIMIHDLFPLKVRGYITKNPRLKIAYFNLMLRAVVRKAKFVFALSETSRKDYLAVVGRRFSDKVGVSLAGPIVRNLPINSNFSPTFTVPDKFLLYVGDRRPHKNIKRIIDLFILLKDKASYSGKLLLVGSTKNHDFDVERYIGSRTDIQIAGQVDDATLALLYQRMDALVFLSKYEGLGLPVVEASLFRKKMIVSDGGALPEFAPPWAFVLPNDVELIHFAFPIKDYLDSPVLPDESYVNKFTWHSAAQRIRNRFIEIMDSNHA
ncbi:glycosyltransferase family 1 protein [Sulfuricella sp.]|uniref:glycosyltransferase family 4 protein n=1 Tax=Sulfuricella sp. TaxID=2099377 RepID=UPI002C94DD7D|nr:glycosyltransferase family 1 protein [Sulfuricella sp.]HUX65238.1 glycosyltransferase family 1 protein [Sulfuricella sp.]